MLILLSLQSCLTLMSTTLAEHVSRPWQRLLRFSVRGLLVLVLVIGGWLGWIVRSARIQREAIRAIKQADGEVSYDWEWTNGVRTPARGPNVPRRLVEAFGVDYFGHVVRVSFSGRERHRILRKAEQLLAELKNQSHAANEESSEPSDLLIGCTLDEARIGPQRWEPNEREAVLPLLKGLSGLSRLDLHGVDLTGDRLLWLEELTSLTHLDLGTTRITDSQLCNLRTLVKLSELDLNDTAITDAGVAHLKILTRLSRLDLRDTRVTDAGVKELRKQAPAVSEGRPLISPIQPVRNLPCRIGWFHPRLAEGVSRMGE